LAVPMFRLRRVGFQPLFIFDDLPSVITFCGIGFLKQIQGGQQIIDEKINQLASLNLLLITNHGDGSYNLCVLVNAPTPHIFIFLYA
jgi:hypothetical protein